MGVSLAEPCRQAGAGADWTSVLQTLSPYNKGLIKRAISQSGVGLCPWAIQENPLFWAKRVRGGSRGRGLPPFHSLLDPVSDTLSTASLSPTPRLQRRWDAPWTTPARWLGV